MTERFAHPPSALSPKALFRIGRDTHPHRSRRIRAWQKAHGFAFQCTPRDDKAADERIFLGFFALKKVGDASRNGVGKAVEGIRGDGGGISKQATDEFDNRKSKVKNEGGQNTFGGRAIVMVMMAFVVLFMVFFVVFF